MDLPIRPQHRKTPRISTYMIKIWSSTWDKNGNQAGDPKKAAKLYIKVAEMTEPYESLPMGTDSCDGIRDICEGTVKLMDEMRSVAETTNF